MEDWIGKVKAHWNEISDSDWYQSLRTEEKLSKISEYPASAFHPAVYAMICRHLDGIAGKRILLPSSGDNHAAFAFSILGAEVTSADISERQLEHAREIADRLGLKIQFVCDDTMELSRIPDDTYDLVYTSNGTLTWISDLNSMYRNIHRVLKSGGYSVLYDMHPFNRPFSGEAWTAPRIVKSYHDVFPELHWRVQDIVNANIRAGLSICELAELPAMDASFWYTYAELIQKNPEELTGLDDWRRNPMAALPAWLALAAGKS